MKIVSCIGIGLYWIVVYFLCSRFEVFVTSFFIFQNEDQASPGPSGGDDYEMMEDDTEEDHDAGAGPSGSSHTYFNISHICKYVVHINY